MSQHRMRMDSSLPTRTRVKVAVAIAFIFVIMLTCQTAAAWSNGGYSADPENPDYGTHDWIADRALNLQTKDVSHFMTTYHDSFLIGTEAPDNPDYIGDSANHHVYYYSGGSVQDDVCADRAKAMYDYALSRLTSGDFEVAAYYMGAMAHYISDVGVFGHTMGAYTDWGSEVHHSDYESYFESILGTLTLPSTISLGDSSAYDATMDLARTVTFGSGTMKANVWMDDNYDWSDDVFKTSAKASLYQSVYATAAAINHLMKAAEPPPEEPDPVDPEPEDPEPETPTYFTPDPPASLDAYVEGSEIVLVWSPPGDDGGAQIIEYRIYRGTELNSPRFVESVSSYSQTWRDSNAQAGTTYYYWVIARNSAGESEMSEVASATLPVTAATDSLFWPVLISSVSAAVAASAGLLLWRRSRTSSPPSG